MINYKKLPPERQAWRFFVKKKWSKAIEEYQKCLDEDANDIAVINLLGDTYYRKKDTEEAFDYYRKALEAYETEGLFDNAIAVAKKMSRLDPDDSKIHLKLAQLYTDQAFITDAMAHVKTYRRYVGKKIDEAAILGVFQKIAGMTFENPGLWDQIVECYRSLEINDPELDKIMAPENYPAASVDPEVPPAELPAIDHGDELISTTTDDVQDQAADTDTQLQESTDNIELSDILDNVLPSEQAAMTPSEFPVEPEPAADIQDEPPVIDEAESLILEESEVSESSDDTTEESASESEPTEAPSAPSPPPVTVEDAEVSLDTEIPSISSELHDEPIAKPLAVDTGEEEGIIPQDSGDDAQVAHTEQPPSLSEDTPDSRTIEAETQDDEQDIPKIIAREETDTSETFTGFQDQTGVGSDEEVLWTLPYDVAEESVPGIQKEEEALAESTQEHEVVESILTGFSADEAAKQADTSPPDKADTETEDDTSSAEPQMATIDDSPPVQASTPSPAQEDRDVRDEEITEQEEEDKPQESEPPVSAESEAAQEPDRVPLQEQDGVDSAGLQEDLQSLELSELAELNREQSRVVTSFDGKEHFEMGKVYKEMKLWDAAIAEFKTAATDPNWRAKSCITLAECFREKGDMALAISQLKWALSSDDEMKEDSDKYDLLYELGTLYEHSGDYTEAREEFQAVHRWNPSYKGIEKKLLELRKRMQTS